MVYDVRRGRWPLVSSVLDEDSLALVPSEDASRLSVADEADELPTAEALELAESILQRLKPTDRHEMGAMVYRNAVASGVLLMAVVLFWWLTVTVFGDELGSEKAPASLIMGWNYMVVAAVVPLLVFVATVLMKMSRERSEPWPGFLAGAMLILGVFMALEPIGHLAFGGAPPQLMLHSARLLALGVMVYYCASMFLDALLLSWVRNLLTSFSVDISPLAMPTYEGQAEEEAPTA
jgi:hypothetical protein